jgi:predicted RecB family nuclease
VLLFQPRLEADLAGWHLRGDLDLVRLERDVDGSLNVLIGDMKASAEVKVEHRLQVAFYRLMLERLFKEEGIAHQPVQLGILFRPPAGPTPEEEAEIKPLRDAAKQTFGLDSALLELVADPQAYLQAAHDLVLGSDSTARRVAQAPFKEIPYSLSFKCDGCLYNEFCMKWSAEQEDLSLLPHFGSP